MNVKKLVAVVAVLFAASGAQAAIFTYTGDTNGAPTFNRPVEELDQLSLVGTDVRYNAFTFTASVNGDYTFLTTAGFDPFGILYSSFSPTSPLDNAIAANDDLLPDSGLTTSGLFATLTAGQLYTYVVTGFSNADFGGFSTTIGGPGQIAAAVPLPAAAWLLLSGIGAAGAFARRRTRQA